MRRGMNNETAFVIHSGVAFATTMWPMKHRLVSCIRNLMWAWVFIRSFIMPSLSVLASPKRLPAMLRLCLFMVGYVEEECYLVDPASSHMLVSKIKPCMCKYEQIQTVKLRMAH